MLAAAQAYVKQGKLVLPLHSVRDGHCTCGRKDCSSPGKHPLTQHGVNDATDDEAQVAAWWSQWPFANIGIATGARSGIAVIDVDPRNGGYESLSAITVPDTLTAQTGSGGLHIYLTIEAPVRGTVLAPGIDLKADGGYVVAPPSLHIQGSYTWLDPLVPMAPMPQLSVTQRPAATDTANHHGTVIEPDRKDWVVDLLTSPCAQGQRNNTLTRLSGYFRNVLPERVTMALMEAWNSTQCDPPMSIVEIRSNVAHKYQRYPGIDDAPIQVWTARTLLEAQMPDPVWVIESMLPEGLTVLGGRPKRGKSWLALQIALDVISSGSTLNQAVHPGRVIYLALEDSPRRLQTRLKAMRSLASDDLMIYTQFPTLDSGGIAELADLLETHRPVFVVIDTMARILGRRSDQDSNSDMTHLLSPVQHLALAHHAAIMLVDHHRKPGLEIVDAIDDIMGSTAKTGVADAIWGLYRKSGESTGTLKITGRDLEEQELAIAWDSLRFRWRVEGDASAKVLEQRLREVMDLIDQVGEVDIKAIANHLNVSEDTASNLMTEAKARRLIDVTPIQTGQRGRPRFLYSRAREVRT